MVPQAGSNPPEAGYRDRRMPNAAEGAREGRHETGGHRDALPHQADARASRLPVRQRGIEIALRRRIEGRQDPRLLAGVPAAHDVSRGRDRRHHASAEVPQPRVGGDDVRDHARQRPARPTPGLGVGLRALLAKEFGAGGSPTCARRFLLPRPTLTQSCHVRQCRPHLPWAARGGARGVPVAVALAGTLQNP